MIVTTLAGSALYAVSLSMLCGAAFITAGASHPGATDILLGGTSLIALVIEARGVTLAGTVTSVLATRSVTASRRCGSSPRKWSWSTSPPAGPERAAATQKPDSRRRVKEQGWDAADAQKTPL